MIRFKMVKMIVPMLCVFYHDKKIKNVGYAVDWPDSIPALRLLARLP